MPPSSFKDRYLAKKFMRLFTERDLAKLRTLLRAHPCLADHCDSSGQPALCQAVEADCWEMAELLVEAGADINAKDSFTGETPLFRALQKNELFWLLMKAGADVNAVDKMGVSPLHLAVNFSDLKLVEVLVEAGANVNAQDQFLTTPLHTAATFGSKDILELLINANASLDTADGCGQTALHLASNSLHLECVKRLVEAGADARLLDQKGKSAAYNLVNLAGFDVNRDEIRDIFYILTDASVTVDGATAKISPLVPSDVIRAIVPEDTPFWVAANNDAPMLAVELAGGLDPNMRTDNGMTLLHWACAGDAPECVLLLLEAGADINVGNPKPIFYCMHELSDCLDCLMSAGVDHNRDYDSHYALHYALAVNSAPCTAALAEVCKQQIKLSTNFSHLTTSLKFALLMHPVPVDALRALLAAAGKRVLREPIGGMPALYFAIQCATVDAVRTLVEAGAIVHVSFREYNNAHRFAEHCLREAASPLVNARLTAIHDYLVGLDEYKQKLNDNKS